MCSFILTDKMTSVNRNTTTLKEKGDKKPKLNIPCCFRHHMEIERVHSNPTSTLKQSKLLDEWEKIPDEEKERFKNMTNQEKIQLCKTYKKVVRERNPESKAQVKAYDCERKKTERKDLKLMKENEAYCSDRFRSILSKAKRRYESLMIENNELEIELAALSSKNNDLDIALVDEESALRSWKGKFKVLYEEHRDCKDKS